MPLPPDVEAHVAQRGRIFDALAETLAAIWVAVDYDDADRYFALTLPAVNAALRAQAAAGAAWVAQRLGGRVAVPDVPYGRLRAGKAQHAVYRRPLLEIGRQIGLGKDWREATSAAGERLLIIAETDQQSAYTHKMRDLLSDDDRVAGYRRVVSGVNACTRCVSAAGDTLPAGELLPKHDRCSCGIVPIVGRDDPGVLVAEAAEAPKTKVRVEQHDELGPQLVEAGHSFAQLHA